MNDSLVDPLSATFGSEGNAFKMNQKLKAEMRQNSSTNLSNHFSRFGYNEKTGILKWLLNRAFSGTFQVA
jgi:hypothetical protein